MQNEAIFSSKESLKFVSEWYYDQPEFVRNYLTHYIIQGLELNHALHIVVINNLKNCIPNAFREIVRIFLDPESCGYVRSLIVEFVCNAMNSLPTNNEDFLKRFGDEDPVFYRAQSIEERRYELYCDIKDSKASFDKLIEDKVNNENKTG